MKYLFLLREGKRIRPNREVIVLSLLITGLIFLGFISAESEQEKLDKVRDSLLYAIDYQGNNTNKPIITLSKTNKRIASTNNNKIFIDKKAYELLKGASVLDEGLALLIGHELGHISQSYPHQGAAFSVVPLDLENYERNPCDTECKKMEQFCDYFGCFTAYRAGYDIWAKAPKILDILCAGGYDCAADELYKSKQERISALQNLRTSVEEMSKRFDTANALTLIGKHTQAREYYETIYDTFPSREIKNNIALTYLLESMSGLPEPVCCFAYPFELDHETRLRKGVRGEEDEEIEEANRLVEQAIDTLKTLTGRYPDYTPALFNLGCAYLLNEKYDTAMQYFSTCIFDENDTIRQKAELGKAIASYFEKDDTIALQKLKNANTSIPNIRKMAALNLQKIEKECNTGNKKAAQNCEKLSQFPRNDSSKIIQSSTNTSKIYLNHNDTRLKIMDKSATDIQREFCPPYSTIFTKSGFYNIYKHEKEYEEMPDVPSLTIRFNQDSRVVEYFLFYE